MASEDSVETVVEQLKKLDKERTRLVTLVDKLKKTTKQKQKELDDAHVALAKKSCSLRQLEMDVRTLQCKQKHLIKFRSRPKLQSGEHFREQFLKQCCRLMDITILHHQDIKQSGAETHYDTRGFIKFEIKQKDKEKIEKILVIPTPSDVEHSVEKSIECLEILYKSTFGYDPMKGYTTGDISYVTYTGYGYVLSILQKLYKDRCKKCQGIRHEFHSCEETFKKFPQLGQKSGDHGDLLPKPKALI